MPSTPVREKKEILFKNTKLKLEITPVLDANVTKQKDSLLGAARKFALAYHRYSKVLGLQSPMGQAEKSIVAYLRTQHVPDKNYTLSFYHKKSKKWIKATQRVAATASISERSYLFQSLKARLRLQVSDIRNNLRYTEPELPRRVWKGRNYHPNMLGKVHMEDLFYLNLILRARRMDIFSEKAPRTDDNHVGVELEFMSKLDRNKLGALLTSANLYSFCTLKDDGSIRAESKYPFSHELCVVAKETEILDVIKRVCVTLAKAGCKVNKTCGMHVHLDMRNRDKTIAFANLVAAQNFLYLMNPASRTDVVNGMRYCAPTRTRTFSDRMDRYSGINGAAYARHKTIEVRIHAGTVDVTKISNWISILLKIANKAEMVKRTPIKFTTLARAFDFTMEQSEYMVARIKKFAENSALEEAA